MKTLNQLVDNCDLKIEITGIKTNSNAIKPGDLFLCISGNVDRHSFIPKAIEKGAVAVITQKEIDEDIPYIVMKDLDNHVDEIYSRFFDYPQNELTIIGVTGTDGKTSTTTMIQTLLGKEICGYIGTNGYSCSKFDRYTDNTTPGKEMLYQIFREFVDAGCKYVAMETSSEAFFHKRLDHLTFASGAITNIDSEHLNTHKTLENYIDCKKQLFRQTKGFCILNSNCKHHEDVLDACLKYLTYGYKDSDDLQILDIQIFPNKSIYTLRYQSIDYKVNAPLLGKFNAENLSCALLTLLSLGFDINELLKNVKDINVPGRMDIIDLGQDFHCIVDYAHTPNGLTRLFEFTKTLDVNRVISVSGQAGERDAVKRKFVGKIISDNSDKVFFTYEDPRNEDINHIIDDMVELVNKDNYERVLDRHEAIVKAVNYALPNDLILVLGKGSEDYQIMKDYVEIEFSDIEECKKAIENRLKRNS